jgi:hypothetical protein
MNTKKRNRQNSDYDSLFYWRLNDEISTAGIPIGSISDVYYIKKASRLLDKARLSLNDDIRINDFFRKL